MWLESREFRLEEFFRRLFALPAAKDFEEAYRQVESTLNQVENELTSIPYSPHSWATDGRMYPPQEDSRRSVPDFPQVVRFRSRHHSTFIAANGAIEIRRVTASLEDTEGVLFQKLGANGLGVWENEPD